MVSITTIQVILCFSVFLPLICLFLQIRFTEEMWRVWFVTSEPSLYSWHTYIQQFPRFRIVYIYLIRWWWSYQQAFAVDKRYRKIMSGYLTICKQPLWVHDYSKLSKKKITTMHVLHIPSCPYLSSRNTDAEMSLTKWFSAESSR